MKTKLLRRPLPRLWTAGMILALAGAIGPGLAQFGGQGRATGFKFRDVYEAGDRKIAVTNRVRTFVAGAEGIYLSNKLFQLISTTLENYAPAGTVTNLVAVAPECLLDTSNRLVSSTGRLDLLGLQRRLIVKGNEGFLFYLTNSTLIVSGHVRTYIHPELLRSSSP